MAFDRVNAPVVAGLRAHTAKSLAILVVDGAALLYTRESTAWAFVDVHLPRRGLMWISTFSR